MEFQALAGRETARESESNQSVSGWSERKREELARTRWARSSEH
ncbi:hypothetical protein A2U01_0100440, partial [Trifolium medium]|nr:hypothetical protein [Trifolium medium]